VSVADERSMSAAKMDALDEFLERSGSSGCVRRWSCVLCGVRCCHHNGVDTSCGTCSVCFQCLPLTLRPCAHVTCARKIRPMCPIHGVCKFCRNSFCAAHLAQTKRDPNNNNNNNRICEACVSKHGVSCDFCSRKLPRSEVRECDVCSKRMCGTCDETSWKGGCGKRSVCQRCAGWWCEEHKIWGATCLLKKKGCQSPTRACAYPDCKQHPCPISVPTVVLRCAKRGCVKQALRTLCCEHQRLPIRNPEALCRIKSRVPLRYFRACKFGCDRMYCERHATHNSGCAACLSTCARQSLNDLLCTDVIGIVLQLLIRD
jgi:hypothetical protein